MINASILNIINATQAPILQDEDNQYFYDFLQARISQGGERLSQELATLRGNILVNLSTKSIKPEIIEKMEWLINYYYSSCVKNGLRQRITIETLARFKIDTSNIYIAYFCKRFDLGWLRFTITPKRIGMRLSFLCACCIFSHYTPKNKP